MVPKSNKVKILQHNGLDANSYNSYLYVSVNFDCEQKLHRYFGGVQCKF